MFLYLLFDQCSILIFSYHKIKFDSHIIGHDLDDKLNDLCEFPSIQKWKLQYRATRDGCGAEDFHNKCDGIRNTLTVIKATSGNVFGAFTTTSWISGEYYNISNYNQDSDAFIFSLINNKDKPFKAKVSSDYTGKAVYTHKDCGPSFGGNENYRRDIYIASNSNTNTDSLANFTFTYEHPDYSGYDNLFRATNFSWIIQLPNH